MSDQAEQRPNSQQKKTGISIITDPLQHKKPAIADDQIFKPPPISAMRAANAPDNFLKPSLADLRSSSDPRSTFSEIRVNSPNYKPYTVEEYRELQHMDELSSRGGLGPSFDDEWERKKEMRTRLMQFGQKAMQDNRAMPKRTKPRQQPKKGQSKHQKMMEYATKIPKPKPNTKIDNDRPMLMQKPKPVVAKYDINAELQRHLHFVQRVDLLRKSLSKYLD